MSHEDSGGRVDTRMLQAEATVIAKFLRQKLTWHDGINVKTNTAGAGCTEREA